MYVQLTDYFIIVVLTIKLANKRRIILKQQPWLKPMTWHGSS